MALNPPSLDIKDMLVASSAGLDLTFATDLFVSEIPPEDQVRGQCVVIYDTGGFDRENPSGGLRYEKPTIQVLVRGDRGDYEGAHELAQDITDVLHGLGNETVNGARYIGIWAQGDVLWAGYDENHRPRVTVNFRIHRTDAS